MIVVDTSALMAMFLNEPEARDFGKVIFAARKACVAAPTAFEYLMIAGSRRRRPDVEPRDLLSRPMVEVVPWDEGHALVAHQAFNRYGKGQGHRAQLNFGDCISYALAKSLAVPLLYKGGDFAQTDIISAL